MAKIKWQQYVNFGTRNHYHKNKIIKKIFKKERKKEKKKRRKKEEK